MGLFFSSMEGTPRGMAVVSGEAHIVPSGAAGKMVIESGNRTILDWKQFSVAEQEHLHFQQADSQAVVLNRVTGNTLSSISGNLSSNGKVFLLNPMGIVIGPQAKVNTAGFLASTFDVLNEDFLQNRELQFHGESEGQILNQGSIECLRGDIILVAKSINNKGSLSAPNGHVALASGFDLLFKPEGTERIFIRTHSSAEALQEGAAIENSGLIQAAVAELRASANPYAKAILHRGTIEAASDNGGEIYLAAEQGMCEVSGSAIAKGGTVHVLGDNVHLVGGALIDVSAEGGGGKILVGGDYQGKNPEIKNAKGTLIDPEVCLKANALGSGNGGKVIVWADRMTMYYGDIQIEGGSQGGNGGFAEISGKSYLSFQGSASGKAPLGKPGDILLDPTDITITGTSNPSGGSFSSIGGTESWESTANSATIPATMNSNSVAQLLGSANVTINTSATPMGEGPYSGTGNITVSSPIMWSTTNTLTFTADSSIAINAAITNNSTPTGTAFPAINFSATTGAPNNPMISIGAAISTIDGNIALTGTATGGSASGIALTGAGSSLTTTGAGGITLNGTGSPASSGTSNGIDLLSGSAISTGGGSISLTGNASGTGSSVGINVSTGSVTSTTGTITVSGTSAASGNNSHGVDIEAAWTTGTSGLVTFQNCSGGMGENSHGINVAQNFTTSGNITAITGIVSGIGDGSNGFNLADGGVVFQSSPTGSNPGNIQITATASTVPTGVGQQPAYGIYVGSASSTIQVSGSDTITLIGESFGTNAAFNAGVYINGTVAGVSGALQVAGSASNPVTDGGSAVGVVLNNGSPITGTSSPISVSGTSLTGGDNSYGVDIEGWTTGTTGTVTFGSTITDANGVSISGCVGAASTFTGNGINVGGAFSTGGAITMMGVSTGTLATFSYGFYANAPFGTTSSSATITIAASASSGSGGVGVFIDAGGEISARGGNISITGSSASSNSGVIGIYMTSSTTNVSTIGSGTITLIGTSTGANGNTNNGIQVFSGQITTVSGSISLTGTGGTNGTTSSHGIYINGTANGISSTNGNITFTGVSHGSSSHGVFLAAPWTTVTSSSGTLMFTNCTAGGSGATGSDAVNVAATLTTLGAIQATGLSTVIGTGNVGFNLAASTAITAGGNIQITASTTGGNGSGILLGAGSTMTVSGTNTATLTGHRTSAGTGAGVQINGSLLSSGSGLLSVTGTSAMTSVGVILNGTSAIGGTGGGSPPIFVSGTSTATGASGHGVSITAAWTTETTGLVTFSSCSGGTGATSHGINLASGASFSTGGSVVATSGITGGTGAGSVGFLGAGGFQSTGAGNSIQITASGAGTGASHGISLTSGALSTAGSGAITLIGTCTAKTTSTGGASGINISGGTISTASGAINLTGIAPAGPTTGADIGILMATSNGITSSSGLITIGGTSATSGASSYGVSITSAWTPGTTAALSITGTSTSAGATSHGINIGAGAAMTSKAGGISFMGTPGSASSSYGTAFGGTTVTTAGGAVFVTGSSQLANNLTINTTNGTAAGANITFSTSSATINGASAGAQTLTLLGGTGGTVTLGGAVGGVVSPGAVMVSGGQIAIQANISTDNALIALTGPVIVSNNPILTTVSGLGAGATITNSTTVDAASAGGSSLTYNAGSSSVTFGGALGGMAAPSSLQVTGAGGISVMGAQSVTTGPMAYIGNVSIQSNTTFTNEGTFPMQFQNSGGVAIQGNYNLQLTANSTSIAIAGDIHLLGSSGSAGGILTASGNQGITVNGQILTQGGNASLSAGGNGGNISLTASGGSIAINNINTSGGNGTTGGNAGSITLIPSKAVGSQNIALGTLVINADLSGLGNLVAQGGSGSSSGTGGTITLSASRTTFVSTATITSSIAGNDISIACGTFTVGDFEVMTALGNLTITAGTSITLFDTIALKELTLAAPVIHLQTHGTYEILNNLGTPYANPILHFYGGTGYSVLGLLDPPLGAIQELYLSAYTTAELQQLLVYSDPVILNFYFSGPVPPGSTLPNSNIRTPILNQMAIAEAELTNWLPILPDTLFSICATEAGLPHCPYSQHSVRAGFGEMLLQTARGMLDFSR